MKGGTDRRWTSPDRLGGDITNPQSLNRYAYALNNPTTLTDPSGLQPDDCSDSTYFISHAECGGVQGPNGDCISEGDQGCITIPFGLPVGGGVTEVSVSTGILPPAALNQPQVGAPGFESTAQVMEQTAPFWMRVIVEACSSNPYCMLAAGVDPEVVVGVTGIGLAAWEIYKLVPHIHYAHRKGKRTSTWDKHTKPRPGRETTKDRQKPGWKPRTPPRPQDIVPKSP